MALLIAHQVEFAADVGGTLHIEPADNPTAGEPVVAWFALNRRGGEPLPLSDCNCTLAVYAQPRQPQDEPLLRPDLTPIAAENNRDIPSARFVFPQIGQYELVIAGEPVPGNSFEPFEISYEVLVATGGSANPAATFSTERTAGSQSPPSETPGLAADDTGLSTPPSSTPMAEESPQAELSPGLAAIWVVGVGLVGSLCLGGLYLWRRRKLGNKS